MLLLDSNILIPWGTWVPILLTIAPPTVLLGVIVWLLRKYGGPVGNKIADILSQQQVNSVLTNALNYSYGAVATAEKGKVASVHVANAQLAAAAEYVIQNAPQMAERLGDTLGPKLMARLSADGVIPPQAAFDPQGEVKTPSTSIKGALVDTTQAAGAAAASKPIAVTP